MQRGSLKSSLCMYNAFSCTEYIHNCKCLGFLVKWHDFCSEKTSQSHCKTWHGYEKAMCLCPWAQIVPLVAVILVCFMSAEESEGRQRAVLPEPNLLLFRKCNNGIGVMWDVTFGLWSQTVFLTEGSELMQLHGETFLLGLFSSPQMTFQTLVTCPQSTILLCGQEFVSCLGYFFLLGQ